jgi:HEAT repeat protein
MPIKSFLGSLFAREQGRSESSRSSAKGCRNVKDSNKAENQARTGRQRALDKLIETLKSENQDLKWAAQSALARVGMPAFDSLVSALHSSEFDLYFGAERAIVQIQDPQLFPRLVPLLTSANDNVRWLISGILGQLKDPRAINVLIPCLEDPYHPVRVEAVKSLKSLGWQPQTANERVVCAVAVRHEDVVMGKFQEAIAMGNLAVGPLSVALLSGGWVVAEQAARALVQIGDESVLPILENVLGWNVRERGLSFGNAQEQALVGIVTILIRLGRLTPRRDEELAEVLAAPNSLGRSAPLERVKTADDLKVGDVIRVWHDYLEKWATGWLEVMRLHTPSDLVCLRSLPGNELITRGIADTVGSAWRWPMK